MQIVIDIPKESFEAIKNKHFAFHDDINDLFSWISDGIPLTSNGLIRIDDANELINKLCKKWHWSYGGNDVGTMGYELAHVFDDLV